MVLSNSVSGVITGGVKDREWKNHKYTTRHRNKDGKWVYDTDSGSSSNNIPMTEEDDSRHSNNASVTGYLHRDSSNSIPMTEENEQSNKNRNKSDDIPMIEEKDENTIIKGSTYITGVIKANNVKLSSLRK